MLSVGFGVGERVRCAGADDERGAEMCLDGEETGCERLIESRRAVRGRARARWLVIVVRGWPADDEA